RNNRSILQQSPEGKDFDFFFDLQNSRGRNQIRFGDGKNRHLYAEQVDDIQVLFGLGHDAVIVGNGKKNQIDSVRAGEQVFDELLVAGYFDDARLRAVGKIKVGKSQIN